MPTGVYQHRASTQCPKGHPYEGENSLITCDGRRRHYCRECRRLGRKVKVLKTHCPKGHPYDEENTVTTSAGRRACRECRRLGKLVKVYKIKAKKPEKIKEHPTPPPKEILGLNVKRLKDMAHSMAWRYAYMECPREMAKDLEQAAWLEYISLKSKDHVWGDLRYAMLEELSRWIWQCKSGRGKNRVLTEKLPIEMFQHILVDERA